VNDAPDNAQRDRQYVVSCDGAPETRFDTLDAALRQAAQAVTLEAFDAGDDADAGPAQAAIRVQIACVRPGQEPERDARPRWCFHIESHGGAAGGDGSELHPWDDWSEAADELARRHAAGELVLAPSQCLALVQRPVFSANRHELRKRVIEAAVRTVLMLITISLIVPVCVILSYLLVRAWPALTWSFIVQNPQDYMTTGGVWAPLVGTFYLVAISLLIAAPLGVLAGVYLNEYARDSWFTRIVNLAVMNLAGVPSIVHALFGVGAFVLFSGMGKSVLAASCTLAVMTLPVIITSTREALAAVPMSFRQACWNLGASRWQTIRTIVLPNSISGILTGVILQVSRAAGETAPILFTGAVFFVPVAEQGWEAYFPYGLHDRCMALSMHLFTLCTQVNGASDELQYATAVVLIGLVLAVNSTSIVLRVYLRTRKKW